MATTICEECGDRATRRVGETCSTARGTWVCDACWPAELGEGVVLELAASDPEEG